MISLLSLKRRGFVAARDVTARLHLDGLWANVLKRVEADANLNALIDRDGIVIPSDDLQRAVDEYRTRRGLHSKEATFAWLKSSGLRMSQLVAHVRARLQREVLLAAIPASAVVEWFETHRKDYDAALLSALSFSNETDAWLARTALEAGSEDFHGLAWSRTQADPELPLGGALGWRIRRHFPEHLASRIFDEEQTELVGPLLVGSVFYIYRVWERRTASLTPALEALCRWDYLEHRSTEHRDSKGN